MREREIITEVQVVVLYAVLCIREGRKSEPFTVVKVVHLLSKQ